MKQITYPTKGWTEFIYEPHQYDAIESRSRDYSYFGKRSKYSYITQKEISIVADRSKPATHTQTIDLSDLFIKNNQSSATVDYKTTFYHDVDLCKIDYQTGTFTCRGADGSTHMCIEELSGECAWVSSATCITPPGKICTSENNAIVAPGMYTFKASFAPVYSTDDPYVGLISLRISYTAKVGFDPKDNARFSYAGGLRIAKIIDHDGINEANNKVVQYNYNIWLDKDGKDGPEEYSAGKLMAMPQYSYVETHNYLVDKCTYQNLLVRTSDSTIPLNGSASGSVVGYDQVTALYGENGQFGKTVYQYENLPDQVFNYDYILYLEPESNGRAALGPARPPAVASLSYERNGLLKMQSDYKYSNGGFQLVKQTENDWSTSFKHNSVYYAFERYKPIKTDIFKCDPAIFFYPAIKSNWIYINWTKETFYDQTNAAKANSVTTTYTYENNPVHFQPKSVAKTTSLLDKTSITSYSYPADYISVTTGIIARMKGEKHIHNIPIETIIKEQKGSETKVVGGTFVTYEDVDGNAADDKAIIVPTKVEALELREPKSSFTSSTGTGSAADEAYKVKQVSKYNATTGNLEEITPTDNISTTYVWGYDHTLPVAEVKNASQTEVNKVIKDQSIKLVDANNKPLADNLMQEQLEKLRLALPKAMVTTFTYEPLKGMTSQTGPDGIITTYHYDDLGRLQYIKDQYGKIVKNYVYHYKSVTGN